MLCAGACSRSNTVQHLFSSGTAVHADAPGRDTQVHEAPAQDARIHDAQATAESTPEPHHIRSTGTIQAVRVSNVVVPTLRGPGGALTLITMIHNGSIVKQGDILAEFDPTQQVDDARDARAKVDDLGHQT
jgi:multidrug efflux pump subunit AcrA (membrane-fusion protein)